MAFFLYRLDKLSRVTKPTGDGRRGEVDRGVTALTAAQPSRSTYRVIGASLALRICWTARRAGSSRVCFAVTLVRCRLAVCPMDCVLVVQYSVERLGIGFLAREIL